MPIEKRPFLKNTGLLLSARDKIHNNFKSKIFPGKNPEPEEQPETAVFDTPKPTKERARTMYIV